MTENKDILGKKVFFLNPSAVVQNRVTEELIQQEFEVYIMKDPLKVRRILKKYPDSIVFANISDGMKENAWEEWIRSVMGDSETAGVDIGIVASADNASLRSKYTEQFKVRCGYTVLKSELSSVLKQLVDILNSVNSKGRRKYIRAETEKEVNTTINLPINGTFVNGIIKDISTVGFSCSFAEDPGLTKNGLFSDIQIRLATQIIKAEGIVFGSRMDETDKIYVIIFTKRISPDVRTKIRKFIQFYLQTKMDSELK